jgi:Predicted transcriptional regulators
MDVQKLIGANIRRYRLEADLSQEAVAEHMGVDRAYISGLEVGARNPTVVTLWHCALALNVKIAQLFDETVDPAAPLPKRKRAPKRIRQ